MNIFPDNKIEQELINAYRFKEQNEFGKSRVCARKAAGYALKFFLIKNFEFNPNQSPFDALQFVSQAKFFPKNIQTKIDQLLIKVDINYNFPDEIDLIVNAEQIIQFIKTTLEE